MKLLPFTHKKVTSTLIEMGAVDFTADNKAEFIKLTKPDTTEDVDIPMVVEELLELVRLSGVDGVILDLPAWIAVPFAVAAAGTECAVVLPMLGYAKAKTTGTYEGKAEYVLEEGDDLADDVIPVEDDMMTNLISSLEGIDVKNMSPEDFSTNHEVVKAMGAAMAKELGGKGLRPEQMDKATELCGELMSMCVQGALNVQGDTSEAFGNSRTPIYSSRPVVTEIPERDVNTLHIPTSGLKSGHVIIPTDPDELRALSARICGIEFSEITANSEYLTNLDSYINKIPKGAVLDLETSNGLV